VNVLLTLTAESRRADPETSNTKDARVGKFQQLSLKTLAHRRGSRFFRCVSPIAIKSFSFGVSARFVFLCVDREDLPRGFRLLRGFLVRPLSGVSLAACPRTSFFSENRLFTRGEVPLDRGHSGAPYVCFRVSSSAQRLRNFF